MKNLIEIANTLNCNNDVQSCCTSNNINKWSFHKPVNHESYGVLTQEQFYSVDDGFRINSYDNPRQMMYNILHNNALWGYINRESPYRLADFDDYIHSGDLNFNIYFVGNNYGNAGDTIRLDCNYDLTEFAKWNIFSRYNDYDICCIFYEPGTDYTQSGTTGIYVEKLTSVADYDGILRFKIPSLSNGQYEGRICFSTATSSMADRTYAYEKFDDPLLGDWIPLPQDSYFLFNIDSGGGGGGGGSTDNFFSFVTFDYDNIYFDFYDPYIYNLHFDITVQSDNHVPINVYAEVYYTNVRNGPLLLKTFNVRLDSNGESKTVYIESKDDIDAASTAQLDNDIISVYIVANVSYAGQTQLNDWTEQLEKS